MIRQIRERLIDESSFDKYPKCGIFYADSGSVITRKICQWAVNPDEGELFPAFAGLRIEHRDMWDIVIREEYPELAARYEDDHKALPRGRVELVSGRREPLKFAVTLCPCLDDAAIKEQIRLLFELRDYPVEWLFGTMNYLCRSCQS